MEATLPVTQRMTVLPSSSLPRDDLMSFKGSAGSRSFTNLGCWMVCNILAIRPPRNTRGSQRDVGVSLGRIRVAAVQTGIYGNNPGRALKDAEALVRGAAEKGARLISLPEHWLLSKVLKDDDPILRRFTKLAEELDAYINLGAYYESRDGRTHLTSLTVSPRGSVLSRQDKVHLYRREKRMASEGSGFRLVTVDGARVGVLVCHDVVFPESSRTLTLMGAELLVVPSFIAARGTEPWLVYLRARALENRVPVVAPNVYHPPKFLGRSSVIDLIYDKKEHVMELFERTAQDKTTSVVVDLDLASKSGLRRERLRELRPNAYLQPAPVPTGSTVS
ncbi:MAG: carbon-nitrogen hydrolase family protein [Thaumarchaeota archaeon]|nr:MAG: carbon-nitrogen hydrolase family protein [Nitrososphaerota archaeon]